MGKINYKLINFAILSIIFFLLTKTIDVWKNIFDVIKTITLPFIISFTIAYVLDAISKLFRKTTSKNIAKIITILLVLLIIFIVFYCSFPIIVKQILSFTDNIDYFLNNVNIDLSFIKESFIKEVNIILKEFTAISLMKKSIKAITNIIIIIILTIYFLFKIDNIKIYIKSFFKNRLKVLECLKSIDISLNNYLKGLSIIIILEIFEYSIIYFIIGHPNYLLLGFLAGITTIIPYFGGLFTNIIALVTALSVSKELFIICAIIAIIMPIVDGYIIDPKIYNKTNEINPFKVIISIIISSSLFGFIGFLIALPSYIIIENIIKYYFNNRKNIKK